MSGDIPPIREAVEPVPAATVMLVRDGEAGLEVFMLKRHGAADFGGAHVFPGGVAGAADADSRLEAHCAGLDEPEADRLLGVDEGGLSYWVTAVRECFEESGYLLAVDDSGAFVEPGAPQARERYAAYRRRLAAGEMDTLEMCEREGLRLACDRLHYVSFWTTPAGPPRRYSTRFFLTAVPPGQRGVHDGRETVGSLWISPRDALAPAMAERMCLHPPTVANLEAIAGYDAVEPLLEAAGRMDTSTIEEIVPKIVRRGGKTGVLMPGDPGYAEADAGGARSS